MTKSLFSAIFCGAFILLSVPTIRAQVVGNPQPESIPGQGTADKSSSKISPDLQQLYESSLPAARRSRSAQKDVDPGVGLTDYLQIRGNMVMVDITVKSDYEVAKKELENMGFKVTAAYGRVISGLMPINMLNKLESAKHIRFARPAYKPMHQSKPQGTLFKKAFLPDNHANPVYSQGDTAQRSHLARMHSRVNGKGVKVGILSDSYNNLKTADRGVMNGELPGPGNPFKYRKPVEILADLDSNGIDEGRAMAEIIHDVAPGAEIAFRTAVRGQADFAQGILDLEKAGCDVITDDIIYFAEPFFQDGIIAQAVDRVKKKGVAYFSAALNYGVRSYESDYRPSPDTPLGREAGTAHNFSAPGAAPRSLQPIFIPSGGTFVATFQWDQPFFSAGGEGAQSDYDIYLLNAQGRSVAGGAGDNIATGDPIEVFGYTNNTPNTTFFLVILKYSGPDATRLKYILLRDGAFFITNPAIPGILASTLFGHPNAEGAIATAAVPFFRTPAYGVDTPLVEPFSSLGGLAIFFNKKGERIEPIVRKKPDITAPDGGNTSFFPPFSNQDIPQDRDTFPNFFGTSAAAPHAAGVAALMIEAQRLRSITPDQIKGILSTNTIDMDNTHTPGFDVGFDFKTGTGLIKADAAVEQVKFPNLYVKNLNLVAICSDDPANTRQWKIINPNPFELKVKWFLTGFAQCGELEVPPGETTFTTKTAYYRNYYVPNVVVIEWEDNFRFSRFDVEASTRATCGREAVAANNTDSKAIKAGKDFADNETTAVVYPNPSPTNFRLYLSLANQKDTDLELFSADGKKLYTKRVQSNGIIDIDASRYKAGVYILKVNQKDFNKTFKLIKE